MIVRQVIALQPSPTEARKNIPERWHIRIIGLVQISAFALVTIGWQLPAENLLKRARKVLPRDVLNTSITSWRGYDTYHWLAHDKLLLSNSRKNYPKSEFSVFRSDYNSSIPFIKLNETLSQYGAVPSSVEVSPDGHAIVWATNGSTELGIT